MESGFSQADVASWAYTGTGVYEGKPKVEDLRLIANLYPESDPPRRKQGRRHQVASPISRASASRSTSRAPARWSMRACILARLRHDREGHQARIPEAEPGGRQAARTARSTPSSSSAAIRPAPSPSSPRRRRHRTRADRRRRRSTSCATQYKFFARTRSPPAPTRTSGGQDARGRRAVGRPRPSSPTSSSTRSPRRSGATRPAPRSTPATPRARSSEGDARSPGVGIPLHPGAEKFYKEAGLLK